MKKKSILILTATVTSSIALATTLLVSNGQLLSLSGGTGEEVKHTVIFDGSTVSASAYDEDYYCYNLTFEKKDAITDADGNKYDLISVDDEAYFTTSDGEMTFGGSSILSFQSEGWESFYVTFRIINRANVDLEKSVISYTVDGGYANVKFTKGGAIDSKYNSYTASVSGAPYYGKTIVITEVKLVFTCLQ